MSDTVDCNCAYLKYSALKLNITLKIEIRAGLIEDWVWSSWTWMTQFWSLASLKSPSLPGIMLECWIQSNFWAPPSVA